MTRTMSQTTSTPTTWTQDSPEKNTMTSMKVSDTNPVVRVSQQFGMGDVQAQSVVLDIQMLKAAARLLGLKVVPA